MTFKMIELPKIINKAELSRRMGISPPGLAQKLKGSQRNSFSEEDRATLLRVLKEAIEEVEVLNINK